MNQTVANFYDKVDVQSYADTYRLDHSPRLQAVISRYGLQTSLVGKRLVDVGGGLGFAGELLSDLTDYVVIDGADIRPADRVSGGQWFQADLDRDFFGSYRDTVLGGIFDAALCQETLEHLSNPYHCLCQIKKLVKIDGTIYISLPTETVWHNVVYPGLMWPRQNWEQFLGQMALRITDFWVYEPKTRGWPAYQWRCVNDPWSSKKLLFPKIEEKFLNCTPLEATNL